jgi:hypothetical protein
VTIREGWVYRSLGHAGGWGKGARGIVGGSMALNRMVEPFAPITGGPVGDAAQNTSTLRAHAGAWRRSGYGGSLGAQAHYGRGTSGLKSRSAWLLADESARLVVGCRLTCCRLSVRLLVVGRWCRLDNKNLKRARGKRWETRARLKAQEAAILLDRAGIAGFGFGFRLGGDKLERRNAAP